MDFTASLLLQKPASHEVPVYGLDGGVVEKIALHKIFQAPLRKDLVQRVFTHLATHRLQPKGASKMSGHKHSVESWGPGFGMARIARVKGRGTPKYGSGGMVPSAVGGRPTHPPVPEKKIHKAVNKKELKNALLSAIAFTASADEVRKRGHRLPDGLQTPIIVVDDLQSLSKTKEVRDFLTRIGLSEELKRCSLVKIRSGKGKTRGRRYKGRKGPLIVVAEDRGLLKAADNIPGLEAVEARNLSVLDLAPGGHPGRLTIYTRSALEILAERLRT